MLKFPRAHNRLQGEASCPWCGARGTIIHQTVSKRIKDHRLEKVEVKRKKCKSCKKTFRHYPEGMERASQTKTLKAISITLYVLGLSYDNVSSFLDALDCGIVKATVWNNLKEAGEEALSLREKLEKEKVRIVGLDTTAFKVAGEKLPEGLEEKLKILHLQYSFAQPPKKGKKLIYSTGCACSP